MPDLRKLFEPLFGDERSDDQRDAGAAVITYRYLRIGMLMVVVALLSSVLIQQAHASCWQGSISAYYYTPARAIFVSGMVAVGVSLIVLKGRTVLEDQLLNFAGMLAPIVAFVPTTFEPACVPGQALEAGPGGKLPKEIMRDAQNNMQALLIAGSVAVAILVVVYLVERRAPDAPATDRRRPLLLGAAVVILAVAWGLLANDELLELHGKAAAVMFAFLALASISAGITLFLDDRGKVLAWSYVLVGAAMLLVGIAFETVVSDDWRHRVLVLEVTEIAMFGALWLVQSIERWGKVTQSRA